LGPADPFDAAARSARLTPVKRDALVSLGQMIEEVEASIDALCAPVLRGGAESARGEHEQRWPVSDHLVVRGDPVDDGGGQDPLQSGQYYVPVGVTGLRTQLASA